MPATRRMLAAATAMSPIPTSFMNRPYAMAVAQVGSLAIRSSCHLVVTRWPACWVFLASSTTRITYPCPTDGPNGDCLSMEKAIVHPSDLWSNVQGSRTAFTTHFRDGSAVVFLVVLVLLLIVHTARAARDRRGPGRKSAPLGTRGRWHRWRRPPARPPRTPRPGLA